MEIYVFTNKILFVYKNIYVQSNLLSGTYPETSHFIPKDFAYIINLKVSDKTDSFLVKFVRFDKEEYNKIVKGVKMVNGIV